MYNGSSLWVLYMGVVIDLSYWVDTWVFHLDPGRWEVRTPAYAHTGQMENPENLGCVTNMTGRKEWKGGWRPRQFIPNTPCQGPTRISSCGTSNYCVIDINMYAIVSLKLFHHHPHHHRGRVWSWGSIRKVNREGNLLVYFPGVGFQCIVHFWIVLDVLLLALKGLGYLSTLQLFLHLSGLHQASWHNRPWVSFLWFRISWWFLWRVVGSAYCWIRWGWWWIYSLGWWPEWDCLA